MSTASAPHGHGWSDRSWRDLTVRFAVGLAFADASIVVLAIPPIIGELDTDIPTASWVIMSYNLALIAGVLTFLAVARRVNARWTLLAGLTLFGLSSLGCGLAGNVDVLILMRAVQGIGGAMLLCASLPLLAGVARPGDSPTAEWAAAAAIGAAIGPALGGLLTEIFTWRAIFFTQAPAAAIAVLAVLAAPEHSFREVPDRGEERREVQPLIANVALMLLSAGLIGALFLEVVLLIDVWRLEPIIAAAVVSAIPITTIILERVARGRTPLVFAPIGAALLAAGLIGIAFVGHEQVGWMIIALALCGAGLGLAFTTLSDSSMSGSGTAVTRAGVTSAARELGLVLGILVLTTGPKPVFVDDLDKARDRASSVRGPIATELFAAPIPDKTKGELAVGLLAISRDLPDGELPDLAPAFDPVREGAGSALAGQLTALEERMDDKIEREVTRSFRTSLLICAVFALAVLPILGIALALRAQRRQAVAS